MLLKMFLVLQWCTNEIAIGYDTKLRVSHSKKHPWNQSIIVIHGCRGESKLKMGLPAITVLLWHASQDFTIGRITGRKFWRKSTVKIAQYARNRGSIFFQRRERSFYPGKTSFAIDETLRSIYIALFFSFLFFFFFFLLKKIAYF